MVESETMKFPLRHFLQLPLTSFLFDIHIYLSTGNIKLIDAVHKLHSVPMAEDHQRFVRGS